MRLKLCQVQGAQNFVFPLWGSHFQSVGGQDFWSKLAFRGEWKPRNSWFSKNGTGQYCAPLFSQIWKSLSPFLLRDLREKPSILLQNLNFLVISDQKNHCSKKLLEKEEFVRSKSKKANSM